MTQGVTQRRMYDSVQWRKARRMWLAAHPVCAMCARQGRTTAANTVDHIKPHNEDYDMFWSMDNWQSLCAQCHSSAKRLEENYGVAPGCDVNGMPLDKRHHWGK